MKNNLIKKINDFCNDASNNNIFFKGEKSSIKYHFRNLEYFFKILSWLIITSIILLIHEKHNNIYITIIYYVSCLLWFCFAMKLTTFLVFKFTNYFYQFRIQNIYINIFIKILLTIITFFLTIFVINNIINSFIPFLKLLLFSKN